MGKSQLAAAYGDDKVDLAIGPTGSNVALAMLPVAEEYKKILLVEPAVADAITGDNWNRYIFRTGRNSTQDAIADAVALPADAQIAMLAQDYAFGRDGVKAFKDALAAVGSKAQIVHEEYVPQATTDFTAPRSACSTRSRTRRAARSSRSSGPARTRPPRSHDLKPERFGIILAPGGNILPVMTALQGPRRHGGRDLLLLRLPEEPGERLAGRRALQALQRRRPTSSPPAAWRRRSRWSRRSRRPGGTDTEKLIAAMEGMSFETPKGTMTFRKEDHQAMQNMYQFRIKKAQANEWDLLDLVREIPAEEIPVPVKNKR